LPAAVEVAVAAAVEVVAVREAVALEAAPRTYQA